MDIIFVKNLKIDTLIGINLKEKIKKQPIILDLEYTLAKGGFEIISNINDTVDYAVLTQRLQEYLATNQCDLLETLAQQLAIIILNEFNIATLKLTITKPKALKHATTVGVTIFRENSKC